MSHLNNYTAPLRSIPETLGEIIRLGEGRAKQKFSSLLVLGLLAGAYIGLGGTLAIKVAGYLPLGAGSLTSLVFGLVFPLGLMLVIFGGASLFTGEVMYMSCGLLRKSLKFSESIKVLLVSYSGNLLGSLALAFLVLLGGNLLEINPDGTHPLADYAVRLSNTKTGLPFLPLFIRGIICNWLVCLAIFMSLEARGGVTKLVLMWPPITAFVALGMEHSIANMLFIPLGILHGESALYLNGSLPLALTATWEGFFIHNLFPVTLGNIVGGALFVSVPYLLVYGGKRNDLHN
ncbi:MAG: formate/nitrite transporter family protein [Deltaproteobacteria bacterium]|jgi:formate/nitrite transporter|nr:formate/nitrite transporter family protein [Deltaproteobacteria bacterium]